MLAHLEAVDAGLDGLHGLSSTVSLASATAVDPVSLCLLSLQALLIDRRADPTEDFMLCKNEDRNPEHCLAEGRKVTRCAQAVISKLRENCLQEFDNHWKCLENNNQVSGAESRRHVLLGFCDSGYVARTNYEGLECHSALRGHVLSSTRDAQWHSFPCTMFVS